MTKQSDAQLRLVLSREARQRLGGISDTTLRRIELRDPSFPKPVFLSARLKGYPSDQFEQYLTERIARGRWVSRTAS